MKGTSLLCGKSRALEHFPIIIIIIQGPEGLANILVILYVFKSVKGLIRSCHVRPHS